MEQDIERYLNNEMTQEEVAAFLNKIDTDPEAKKLLSLYQEMHIVYDQNDWELSDKKTTNQKVQQYEQFLRSDKGKEIASSIKSAEQSYFNEKPFRLTKILKYVAVAAIFIAGLFLVVEYNQGTNTEQLYATYKNWDELPSLTLRDQNSDLTEIEQQFRAENYEESLLLLNTYVLNNDQEVNPQLLMYKGISQLELHKNTAAIDSFTELLESNTLDADKAHWYLALSYLKNQDVEKAKTELELLLEKPTNFKNKEAKELLSSLH
ncbi:hypothetical protein [uncultured Aquimarina sp.]|uniref:tetratricopeptide repeat protein n=1 Tax=uncultured Aquimarina sp. TaxID=575652 RepID=UPI002603178D|nr:hypothetical protein [uncultured Aquimarina sp.]